MVCAVCEGRDRRGKHYNLHFLRLPSFLTFEETKDAERKGEITIRKRLEVIKVSVICVIKHLSIIHNPTWGRGRGLTLAVCVFAGFPTGSILQLF